MRDVSTMVLRGLPIGGYRKGYTTTLERYVDRHFAGGRAAQLVRALFSGRTTGVGMRGRVWIEDPALPATK